MNNKRRQWWKETVAYQIYPRSFYDSNHDGVGDIPGIIKKLDYLKSLGIGMLWISPFYLSPMCDNGYDISDYYRVDPVFGSDDDIDLLMKECEKRKIKVIIDLVVNHCSSEHIWFRKAVEQPDSREAGYFIFKRTVDSTSPNNWRSNFGGSAWTMLEDGRWYLHTFDYRQPDLNWENPDLRNEIYRMMGWWLKKGVAGFRVDAITFIKKDCTFSSGPEEINGLYPIENYQNYPGIEEFLSEMRDRVLKPFGCVTVAEAAGVPYADLEKYAGENGFFSMIFDFSWDHLIKDQKETRDKRDPEVIREWKEKVFRSQLEMQKTGWSPLFLENHDQPRCPDKFFEPKDRNRQSITMLGATYFFLRGTPFIYQGQELGMTNYPVKGIEDIYDVAARTKYEEALKGGGDVEKLLKELRECGRDHARTPFQWNGDLHGGFSHAEPWIGVNPDYRSVNAQLQIDDPESVFSFYRDMIRLRSREEYREVLVYGEFLPWESDMDSIIGYIRSAGEGKIVVVSSFFPEKSKVKLPYKCKEVLLSNDRVVIDGLFCEMEGFQTLVYEAVEE